METELSRPSPLSPRCLDNGPTFSPPFLPTPSPKSVPDILCVRPGQAWQSQAGLRLLEDHTGLASESNRLSSSSSNLHFPRARLGPFAVCPSMGSYPRGPQVVRGFAKFLAFSLEQATTHPPIQHTRVKSVLSGQSFPTAFHLSRNSSFPRSTS